MSVTLNDLHNAIVATTQAAFGSVVETVAAYSPLQADPINTPAVLIEMDSADEGEDCGDGRVPLKCQFLAHCILSTKTPNVQVEVRAFAAQMFQVVRHNNWGLTGNVTRPASLSMLPGEFRPGNHGYESWIVAWEQTLYLGDSVWTGGVRPETVYLGITPNIGAGHEGDYVQIAP